MTAQKPTGALALRILLAWSLVGLPLLWGVSETVRKSLPLFK